MKDLNIRIFYRCRMEESILRDVGFTDGEAKVYIALLKLGSSTSGPIIKQSGVANSIVYRILDSLIEKGVVSYIIKEKTRYYQAAEPSRILDYIEKEKERLDAKKNDFSLNLKKLEMLKEFAPAMDVQMYEGFKGIQTAFEHHEQKLGKDGEYLCFGHPPQETQYTLYWKRHHIKRAKKGIKARMLFDKGTATETMQNRNSYDLSDTRYIPSDLKTKSWFLVYADTVTIFLQEDKELAVEIVSGKIADTFKAIFEDYWKKSKPFE